MVNPYNVPLYVTPKLTYKVSEPAQNTTQQKEMIQMNKKAYTTPGLLSMILWVILFLMVIGFVIYSKRG